MKQTVEERFWSKVKKTNGCWLWLDVPDAYGYGIFFIWPQNKKAHRISWEIHNGAIPAQLHVLHSCDNPLCVNPQHLFLGTQADNNRDCIAKGRHRASKGEDNGYSKLTTLQVLEIRKMYKTGLYTQQSLAVRFKIHTAHVHSIVVGKRWKHLPIG